MKKIIVAVLLALAALATTAWLFRAELLLALISFQVDRQYADTRPNEDVLWSQGPGKAVASDGQRPPNIVLIVADDLGINDLSTFGGGVAAGRVKTPNIDSLAAAGVQFRQSYSGASTCAPSRGMLMTGRYPSRTGFSFTPTPPGMAPAVRTVMGAMDNNLPPTFSDPEAEASKPPYELQGLPGTETTIAEVLKQSGYYTAHIGKWHLGRYNGMHPQAQGFDDSLLMQSGLYLPQDDANVVNARLDFDPIDKFLWAGMRYAANFNSTQGTGFAPGGYLTDYYTDEAVKVIEANKNRPFFLYLAHWGVHTPLQATKEDYDAVGDIQPHRLRVYAAMIRALDRSVGRVVETLNAQGLSENTVVMFTSDNGGAGYLGLPEVNEPFRGWKITSFEGGLRVPLFVKWPARLPAGVESQTPVAHIDVMPTIAAAANASLPDNLTLDGRNLLPLGTPETATEWKRDNLFWVSDHYKVVRHKDWKLQLNTRPTDGLQTWLYDLSEDPTEQVNLASQRPDIVQQLTALLDDYVANAVEPVFPAAGQLPIMIDKTLAEKFVAGDEYIYAPN